MRHIFCWFAFPALIATAGWPGLSLAVVYNVPPDAAPNSLAAGDVMNIGVGGMTTFAFNSASGSFINVNGGQVNTPGTIGSNVEINSGTFVVGQATGVVNVHGGTAQAMVFTNEVNVLGGSVGPFGTFGTGAVLNVYSGTASGSLKFDQAEMNIFGGTMGAPQPSSGSTFNMFGGTFGLALFNGSVLNLSGGTYAFANLEMLAGTAANITGRSFLLNGAPIPGLNFGNPIVVSARDVLLTGNLLDGSSLSVGLPSGIGGVSPDATVTVYLVPEPSSTFLLLCGLAAVALARVRAVL